MKDGLPFGVAGVWPTWKSPAGECVVSFAIITADATAITLIALCCGVSASFSTCEQCTWGSNYCLRHNRSRNSHATRR
jgi:hypothetical protein